MRAPPKSRSYEKGLHRDAHSAEGRPLSGVTQTYLSLSLSTTRVSLLSAVRLHSLTTTKAVTENSGEKTLDKEWKAPKQQEIAMTTATLLFDWWNLS